MTFADRNNSEQTLQDSNETSTPDNLQNFQIRPYKVYISKQGLKEAIEFQFTKYRIADQIGMVEKVIQCESGWNVLADNGVSYGLLQFTPATWQDFGYGDIMNPYSQIETTAKMWSKGLQRRWDCYRMLFP